MYETFFNLTELPYRNTPDPAYMCWFPQYEQAFHMIMYAIEEHEIVLLTGEIGVGKTTVVRAVLAECDKNDRFTLIALIYPSLTPFQLLATMAEALGLPKVRSKLLYMTALSEKLLDIWKTGGRTCLLADESHLFPTKALFDELRHLTNIQLDSSNLLGLVLIGQPEIVKRLKHRSYRAFRQRISMHVQLRPLTREQSETYLRHRWEVAGGKKFPFRKDAIDIMHKLSGGVPRVLNQLAHLSLMEAFGRDVHTITPEIIEETAQSLLL